MTSWSDIIFDPTIDYITYEYCSNVNENWNCMQRIQVIPADSLKVQNKNSAESFSYTAMYVIVVLLLLWIVKGIFRWIIPTRWKK